MNIELTKFNQWFIANRLVLNIQKTHSMIFGKKHLDVGIDDIRLYIDNKPIEQVKTVKFLGVIIDDDIKWKSHVKKYQIVIQYWH